MQTRNKNPPQTPSQKHLDFHFYKARTGLLKDPTATRLTIWGWKRHQNQAGNTEGVTESSHSPFFQKRRSLLNAGLRYLGGGAV